MPRIVKYLSAFVLVVILTAGAFIGGVLLERTRAVPAVGGAEVGTPGEVVDEARRLLLNGALKPSDEASMTSGAVRGLLESLGDKYAEYFDARHYRYFNEQNAGEFGGIGVTLTQKDLDTVIVEVMKGTPAEKAGLKKDDVFYGIDGERREHWPQDAVVSKVRGKPGTTVTIEVRRGGETTTTLAFTLARALIEVPNVESRMIGADVGYVSLAQFNSKSAEEMASAITALDKKGARGFVIDLRDDPGGLLEEAVDVASLFVEEGTIVSVDYRERPEDVYQARGKRLTDKPVVLLVNGYSASASEIVAGALQDHARAKLVGEKTFGKGSVQTVEQLSDGGAIKFTIAHYLTPKKRVIDGVGLKPDVEVKMDGTLVGAEKGDIQLDKAVEVLRAQL